MAAAGLVSCDITPVEGVTVSVRGGSPTNFEVEWRDMRCLPTSSDADVSRNATPRAFVDSAPSVLGLVAILHKIVFGEVLDDTGSKDTMTTVLPNTVAAGGSIVICLQRRRDRACLRRLSLTTDSTTGELQTVTTMAGSSTVTRRQTCREMLEQLATLCSGCDEGFVMVRETCWAELPSELWWHVLRCLTAKQGKAVSCTCQTMSHLVQLPAFIWAPAQLHLGLVQAQEAVRADTSTHLPLNITDQEVRIGRSRRNDVVLLRDPEVSKKHCKLWRDARGEVWIQDLASTNGTKLNGEWLRPLALDSADVRQPSEPRKLKVDDQVVLGLTTLALHDGPCESRPEAVAGVAAGREMGVGDLSADAGGSGSPEGFVAAFGSTEAGQQMSTTGP